MPEVHVNKGFSDIRNKTEPGSPGSPPINGSVSHRSNAGSIGPPSPNSENRDPAVQVPRTASEAFSLILESVGSDGRWQWYLFFVSAICGNFTALHNMGAVFLAAEPQHWCRVPDLEQFANVTAGRDMRNASIPWETQSTGSGRYSRCQFYVRDYAQVVAELPSDPTAPIMAPPDDTPTNSCTAWNFDKSVYDNTIVSEWNLVCSDRWLMSSVQASYMIGFMMGALILSELADKFGRRTLLLVSTVMFSVTTIATYFSVNYLMFISMRFFVAAFGSGIFLSNFVILMESLGLQSRTRFGVLYHIFFSTGMCLLSLLAYFFRDWRQLQLWTSVPTLLLFVYFFVIPESPRWLMMVGRHEEALEILQKMAKWNGGSLPKPMQLEVYIRRIDEERRGDFNTTAIQKCLSFVKSWYILVGTPNMRRRCLIIFYAWFTVSMIYYGLAFNGDNLKLPPFLLMLISGLVEVISCFFNIWILNVCGRRLTLCILLVVCGIACLVIVAIPVEMSYVNLSLSLIGRFFISPGFNVVFMYSAELVPTHVRNIAVGTSSMCARVGSFLAPYIVDLLGDVHYAVPSTVFGGFAVTSGLLSLLLPETGDKPLPESIAEIESMKC